MSPTNVHFRMEQLRRNMFHLDFSPSVTRRLQTCVLFGKSSDETKFRLSLKMYILAGTKLKRNTFPLRFFQVKTTCRQQRRINAGAKLTRNTFQLRSQTTKRSPANVHSRWDKTPTKQLSFEVFPGEKPHLANKGTFSRDQT